MHPTNTSRSIQSVDVIIRAGDHTTSSLKTLDNLAKLLSNSRDGTVLEGKVKKNGEEIKIVLFTRNPKRHIARQIRDYLTGRDIARHSAALRGVTHLLDQFKDEPGSQELLKSIKDALPPNRQIKVRPLRQLVTKLNNANLVPRKIHLFNRLNKIGTQKELNAVKKTLGLKDDSCIIAMQKYLGNQRASQSAWVHDVEPVELNKVAEFAKKWLAAYRKNPNLFEAYKNKPALTNKFSWEQDLHHAVIACANSRPDLMDDEIASHHTPISLKSEAFKQCAKNIAQLTSSKWDRKVAQSSMEALTMTFFAEMKANPKVQLLFATSDPKAFKTYLFKALLAEYKKEKVGVSLNFLQYCRRLRATVDYVYLGMLASMPNRLNQDYQHMQEHALDQFCLGKRAKKQKRVRNEEIKGDEALAFGFTLNNEKYTRVQDGPTKDGGHAAVQFFENQAGHRVAVKLAKATGDKKLYETELAGLRKEVRLHRNLTDSIRKLNNKSIIESLAAIPGPNGELFHIMEIAPYGDLVDLAIELAKPGVNAKTKEAIIAVAIKDTVKAVDAVHGLGLIHQDIKPNNFIAVNVNDKIRYKLCDFGTTVKGQAQELFSFPTDARDFSSPEILELQTKVKNYNEQINPLATGSPSPSKPDTSKSAPPSVITTQASDMWALGVMWFNLYTQRLPFKSQHTADLPSAVSDYCDSREHGDAVELFTDSEQQNIPKAVRELILNLLSPNPEDRPTASELLQDPYFIQIPKEKLNIYEAWWKAGEKETISLQEEELSSVSLR